MIAEFGNFLLALALMLSLSLFILPILGVYKNNNNLVKLAKPLSLSLFLTLSTSFAMLFLLFIYNDFTVQYVVNNSNTTLPIYYRIAAVWGSHEGSLLLWVWLLSIWCVSLAFLSRSVNQKDLSLVLAIIGFVSIGFIAFVLFASNPFIRTFPNIMVEGHELNPMLQDVGLIFHPPLLYLGYVGFSVAFAFSIVALIKGELDKQWAKWARNWTLAAWIFLTLGITLGSWWAYYELGWGGWWFWDPVENASLMPWLAGTALIHSLSITQKRNAFKAWTILLSILAFSLCLLGTFLVRSGILVSVHAFASDPSRGLYILSYLIIVIGGSLFLYASRGSKIKSSANFKRLSRENLLLFNNLLLMAALLVVVSGTLLPLVHKQLGLGSISIGAPFFDQMFIIIMLPFSILLGVAPFVGWGHNQEKSLKKITLIGLILSIIIAILMPYLMYGSTKIVVILGSFMSSFILILSLLELYKKATLKHGFFTGITKLSARQFGMTLAHVGVALCVFGITYSQNFSVEKDVRLAVGQEAEVGGYIFKFRNYNQGDGANFEKLSAQIDVYKQQKLQAILFAEKRFYKVSRMTMTEAAIKWGFSGDIYVALGESLGDHSFAFRLYYKPFIRWIWFGAIFMALGALVAAFRRDKKVVAKKEQQKVDLCQKN